MKPVIAAFDFDGTITTKDTLLEFIRFSKGDLRFLWGFLLHLPLLIAYKAKMVPNWEVKQKLFSYFFKGMKLQEFNRFCVDFYLLYLKLIRPKAEKAILRHREAGNSLVIISASILNWVELFAEHFGIFNVLCTEIEIDSVGCLTGRFSTPNCHGEEKVKRLLQLFPDRENYHLIAYGDSSGDKELLDFADEKFYRQF